MRRLSDDQNKENLKILSEGAKAVAESSSANKRLNELEPVLEKRFAQMHDQIRMLQYALGNVLKTLGTYPAVKAQLDGLDYRTLGTIRALSKLHPNFDDMVEAEAREVRAETFQELSDKDDSEKKLTIDESGECSTEHYVILTSDCKDSPEQAIFRSKMDVGSPEFADVKDAFIGKRVGDSFDVTIQGNSHTVTILGLRRKPDASTQG